MAWSTFLGELSTGTVLRAQTPASSEKQRLADTRNGRRPSDHEALGLSRGRDCLSKHPDWAAPEPTRLHVLIPGEPQTHT